MCDVYPGLPTPPRAGGFVWLATTTIRTTFDTFGRTAEVNGGAGPKGGAQGCATYILVSQPRLAREFLFGWATPLRT
jgi:hypothetical protein